MDPIFALGLASNIIQIVDFSSRVISRGHEIYATGGLEEHTFLDDAARNLSELTTDLNHWETPIPRGHRLTAADKQLLELRKECKALSTKLHNALQMAQAKPGNRKLQSMYQALRSVCDQKEISNLERRLDSIRKQTDTALLVSLRKAIDDFTKSHTSGGIAKADDEAKRRHAELLNAIRECNWQPSRRDDVEEFSNQFHSTTAAEVETRFRNMILARLYFSSMPNRGDSIPEAHSATFEWIFRETVQNSSSTSWDNFPDWLTQKDSGIYWVTGKPGSGKSALMKFLFQHPQPPVLLGKWAKGDQVSMAGFYFWNSGTFTAYGGGRDAFDWLELRRAFKRILSDTSKTFFILIDGLDEFDGKPEEIIDFVVGTVQSNVKICVASRPWPPFERAFGKKPSLLLEQLTYQDISRYVNWHFDNNVSFKQLKLLEIEKASGLVHQIVTRANGVFLWVHLVVQSLLTGLLNSDRMSDLQARLDALPSDLGSLFDKLLVALNQSTSSWHVRCFGYCENTGQWDGLTSPRRALPLALAESKATEMRRRLAARCRGFLEVHRPKDKPLTRDHTVTYLHRTARDFVEADHYWPTVIESAGGDAFRPDERWANAFLWNLKSCSDVWRVGLLHNCISIALHIQWRTMVVQKTYLDEVCRTNRNTSIDGLLELMQADTHFGPDPTVTSVPYLSLVLEQSNATERRDIVKHLALSVLTHGLSPFQNELRKVVDHYKHRPKIMKFLRRVSPQKIPLLPHE